MLNLTSRRRRMAAALALVTAFAVAAPVAEARPGGGSSFGSRGSRTFNAPSATPTAPTAAPMQRTQTAPSPGMTNPGMNSAGAAAARPRFGGGFMAGLLGAGLLGALLGGGFFGGLGGIASMLGLLLQVGLVIMVVMLAIRFFRRRSEPAAAGAPYARSNLDGGPTGGPAANPTGAAGPAAATFGGGRPPQTRPVQIGEADYKAFERLLADVQDAYSREDRVTLGNITTPEMAGYFDEELRNNAARGVVNKISNVKLLQGDLSETWGEDRTEYATVAMRYALKDEMIERASGRVVQTDAPEAVELWTFQRQPGRGWVLSAIQQTR